jgi:hypothetical protein
MKQAIHDLFFHRDYKLSMSCSFLYFVLFGFFPFTVNGQHVRFCDLSQQPVIEVGQDAATGKLNVIETNPTSGPSGARNLDSSFTDNLRGSSLLHGGGGKVHSRAIPTTDSFSRHELQEVKDTSDLTIQVRACYCWYQTGSAYYCPIDKSHCAIPRRSNRNVTTPGCVNLDTQYQFVRSTWIYLLIFIFIIFNMIICTPWGRLALLTLPGNCLGYCGYRDFVADWLMRHNPTRANHLLERNVRRRQRIARQRYRRATGETLPVATPVLEANDTPVATHVVANADETIKPPTRLVLRTSRYVKADVPNEDDCDEATCTICFAPLEDGDRVGALPCFHQFHVDCLKEWLRRRNACPLCQATEVATPQYDDEDAEEAEASGYNEETGGNEIEMTSPQRADGQQAPSTLPS